MVFGDDKKSIQSFQKAIKLNPEKGQNYHNIAFIYSCQGNYVKAEEIIKVKMKQSEDAMDYVVWAGMAYRQKNKAKMRTVCEEGLKKYPQSYDLYMLQAMSYCYEEQYELGEKSLLKAVELSNYAQEDALYKLALAQLAQEKWGSAKIYLEKARELKSEKAGELLKNHFE
jgi:tetratricopeptide (TPR) repeat protein